MSTIRRFAAAAVGSVLVAVGSAACGAASASTGPPEAHVRTIHLVAHHSHWSVGHLDVPARTPVRIVVRNDDPIDHELIVGDQAVQDRHERGTEARHPPRPGEITVPAGTTVETTVWFPQAAALFYGCHLPGHWAYGMHGTITVT